MRRPPSLLLSLLLLAPLTVLADVASFTILVPANRQECLWQPVREGHQIEISYRVVSSHGVVTFFGHNPHLPESAQQAARAGSVRHGQHRLSAGAGDYALCFSNDEPAPLPVSVQLYALSASGEFEEIDTPDEARIQFAQFSAHFDGNTNRISHNLRSANAEQKSIAAIELVDRRVAEETFEKMNFWGIVNTIVVFIAAGTQVFLVRSLLSDGSRVGKLLRHANH